MLMKYKDFKQMSIDEMKKVKGGLQEPGGDEGEALCTSSCSKQVGATIYVRRCRTGVLGCYCPQQGVTTCS